MTRQTALVKPWRLALAVIAWCLIGHAGTGWAAATGSLPVADGESLSAAPITIETQLRTGEELFGGGQDELWLAGLFTGDPNAPRALVLRWVKATAGWFPKWRLQLASDVGLLPGTATGVVAGSASEATVGPTGRAATHAKTAVIDLGEIAPASEHVYSCVFAYDPASGEVSFRLVDETRDAQLVAAYLRAKPSQQRYDPRAGRADAPQDGAGAPRGFTVERFVVHPGYAHLGVPLALAQGFRYAVGSAGEHGFVSGLHRFFVGQGASVRLNWPKEPVPGEVAVELAEGERRTELARAKWSADPVLVPIDAATLAAGSPVLVLEYVVGNYHAEIGRQPLTIVTNEVDVGYSGVGRGADGALQGEVRLKPELVGLSGTLTLRARFIPLGPDDQAVELGARELPVAVGAGVERLPFDFATPPNAGKVTLTASFAGQAVALRGGEATIPIEEAPAVIMSFAKGGPTSVIGRPALWPLGSPYPQVAVTPARDGLLSGEWVRTAGHAPSASGAADGTVVANIPERSVAAGEAVTIALDGLVSEPGVYRIQLALQSPGRPTAYGAIYFNVLPDGISETAARVVQLGADGKLVYLPDYLGNRVPDFSNAGYGGGGVPLPNVPTAITIEPDPGDDTDRIQAAIDALAARAADAQGWRGAVQLGSGTYEIGGQLRIQASGIVLRGAGSGEGGTLLRATGTKARPVIAIGGGALEIEAGSARQIMDVYVPVGARSFHVAAASGLQVGQNVVIRRHGNQAWIHEIGMDRITPRPDDPGSTKQWTPFDLDFDRVITAIDGDRVTVDAPIVNAIAARWGGGELLTAVDRRITQVGVENLGAVSDYDSAVTCTRSGSSYPCDEQHATYLVAFDAVSNAWARNVASAHFVQGSSTINREANWVTVQDAVDTAPVSIITGSRRYTYQILGTLSLVQRARADEARHAFIVGSHVTGPNVFLDSEATHNYATSEPHHRWSVGGLFDNVKAPIAIQDRQYYGSGHGWAGANYVAWNTEGALIAQQPPTAQNWAIGHVGPKQAGAFAPRPDGWWASLGAHVEPESLYRQQLQDRLDATGRVSG